MMTEIALKENILEHVNRAHAAMEKIVAAELKDVKELSALLSECRKHVELAEELTHELTNMAPLRAKELKRKGLDRETGLDAKGKK